MKFRISNFDLRRERELGGWVSKWTLIPVAVCCVAALGFVVDTMQRTSNCGGNSSALAAVASISQIIPEFPVRMEGAEASSLSSGTLRSLARYTNHTWIKSARYLVRTRTSEGVESPVIVVCDTPFSNVPQPAFWNLWRGKSAYAAALSVRESTLLSPAEFTRLDLTNFVALDVLVASAQSPAGSTSISR